MNNDEFFFKSFKSKIVSTNNFIKNNNVKLSTFFEKFVFDLMFNREIYNIEKT